MRVLCAEQAGSSTSEAQGRHREVEREVSRGRSSQRDTADALDVRADEGPIGRESDETAVSPKDARHQKPEQLGLSLEGEASKVRRSGEASTLTNGEERSGSDRLMEQVVARAATSGRRWRGCVRTGAVPGSMG